MLCALSETDYSYELLFLEIMQKNVQDWYLRFVMYVVMVRKFHDMCESHFLLLTLAE